MEAQRFNQFIQLIDGIHKSVSKIKLAFAPHLGVKSVHVLWVYELMSHPEGLTASSLALRSRIDRSLVSREIEELRAGGYVEVSGGVGKRRSYNSRIRLTPKGEQLAQTITMRAMEVQAAADAGVSEQELIDMYRTLEKLSNNLSRVSEGVQG